MLIYKLQKNQKNRLSIKIFNTEINHQNSRMGLDHINLNFCEHVTSYANGLLGHASAKLATAQIE